MLDVGTQCTVGLTSATQSSLLSITEIPLIDATSIAIETPWKPQGRPMLAVNSINDIVTLAVQN